MTQNIQLPDGSLTCQETAHVIFNEAEKTLTPSAILVLAEIRCSFAFGSLKSKQSLYDLVDDIKANQNDYCFDGTVNDSDCESALESWIDVHKRFTS